jgi:hypothetical protein
VGVEVDPRADGDPDEQEAEDADGDDGGELEGHDPAFRPLGDGSCPRTVG